MTINRKKVLLVLINIIFGIAVLISYGYGIATNPETAGALWGSVPESIIPIYTTNMFFAAAGYFAFSFYILFQLNTDDTVIAGKFPYGLFHWLYTLILFPSALWMPLTFIMVKNPSLEIWIAIRVVLAVVGIASLGMLASVIAIKPVSSKWARRFAIVGAVFFSIQTALLDAIIWPVFFPTAF